LLLFVVTRMKVLYGSLRTASLSVWYHHGLPLLLCSDHDGLIPAGGRHADRLATYSQSDVAAADEVLRQVVHDQLRARAGHRPGPGIPVRNELVGLFPLRRGHLRSTARYRSPPGILHGVDVPGVVDLRLGAHTR